MMDFTKRPVTPGWTASRGYPFGMQREFRDGTYFFEFIHQEYKVSDEHGWTYRHIYAITFPEDGRRVEWTSLSSGTYGELVHQARYYESQGLATVTRPERKRFSRPRRMERKDG